MSTTVTQPVDVRSLPPNEYDESKLPEYEPMPW